MTERWKDVPGFEGRYQVSDHGNVRSLDRVEHFPAYITSRGAHRSASVRSFKGKVLRPGAHESGHVTVAIGKGNSRMVHQLVMEAFVGPRPDGQEVLHENHIPADNRLSNLRYGTRSENIKMDFEAGTRTVHPNFNRWGYRYA